MQSNYDSRLVALFAVVTLIGILGAVAVGFAMADDEMDTSAPFLAITALIGSTIPSIIAAFFAARNAHDLRDHTIVEKAKMGYLEGLEELIQEVQDKPKTTQKHRKEET